MKTYEEFMKEKGIYLEPYNGIHETAFYKKDVWDALRYIDSDELIILGGDVYCQDDDDDYIYYGYATWDHDNDDTRSIDQIQKDSIVVAFNYLSEPWFEENNLAVFVVVSKDKYLKEYMNKSFPVFE